MSIAIAAAVMGVVSAVGQVRAGQAQAASLKGQAGALDVQAQFKRLEGRQASLVHKKKAVDQLQAILEHMASTNARAGAGSIDPFSGNPEGVKIKGLNVGGLNVVVSNENFQITRLVSESQAKLIEYQAGRARAAASAAKGAGYTNAIMTLAMTGFSFAQAGGFSSMSSAGGAGSTATSSAGSAATSGGNFGMNVPHSMGGAPAGAYFGTGSNNYGTYLGNGTWGI